MFVCFFFLLMTTVNRPFKHGVLYMGHRQTEWHQMRGVQSVAFIIGFIYGQSIFLKSCVCRSEGVVPANTLKRLVRKRKYKNIFFIKIVFRR